MNKLAELRHLISLSHSDLTKESIEQDRKRVLMKANVDMSKSFQLKEV